MIEQEGEYPYKEKVGVRPVDWEYFHGLCKGLAVPISKYNPDLVLGNGRGGIHAAEIISDLLVKEFYQIRITRRENGIVVHEQPQWLINPPDVINGKKILVVGELCDTGDTLKLIKARCKEMGALEIKTAVLYSHLRGKDIPDYIGFISDELILNPWDREFYDGEKFVLHPEYEKAVDAQGLAYDRSFLHKIKPVKIAKG